MNDISYTTISGGNGVSMPGTVFQARHYIDGEWCDSKDGKTFDRHDPAGRIKVSEAALGGEAEINAAIDAARNAFDDGRWSRISGKERAAVLNKVADLIADNVERIALYETLESGKPISQARGEIEGSVDLWRYAAACTRTTHGEAYNSLGEEIMGMVFKEPVGVVSVITPWNFPFLILSQKVPFALAAGCTVVIKPSEMTYSTAVMMVELLIEAGLPAGVANLVLGFGDPVGSIMSTHKAVDMVTFTGSTAVGKRIVAASAEGLKKTSLELGGKNPQVVFKDADLDGAADATIFGIYFNAGECCNSSSRVLVHEDVADEFIAKLVDLSAKVPFGDPMHPDTMVGALISDDHFNKVHGYVVEAVAQGAKIACGGGPLDIEGREGKFYQPTIIRDVTRDMRVASEEIFGPVLVVLTFKDFDEALQLVNSTDYGLSAGLWSDDVHTCLEFSRRAHAGTVWVNTWMDGFPELPFGGVRESGLGRELGRNGIEEFLETKTVQMRVGHTRQNWVPR